MTKKKIEATDLIQFNKMSMALGMHPMSVQRRNYLNCRKLPAIQELIDFNESWLKKHQK